MVNVEAIDLLAQNYFGNTREGSLAGPIGAFIIAALAVITILLIRNMSVRLRKLPDKFPAQHREEPPPELSDNSDTGSKAP